MEFEHVTFDLPHGTFHALQGGDPDGQPTLVLHGFPDHPPTAKPFLAELGRRGRHVVAPWLRGYAPSPTAGPFDLGPPLASVVAQPLARSSSPGGPTQAPAGEHARAPKVLPADAATRHAQGDAPPISADHGAPAAAPRRRRRLHPHPAGRRPASVRRPAHAGGRPRRRSLPAHRGPRADRGTDRGIGPVADHPALAARPPGWAARGGL